MTRRHSGLGGIAARGAAVALAMAPAALGAAPSIATDSAIYVESLQDDASRHLEPAGKLSRGDKVVTIVTWYRLGGNGAFTITNSLPRHVSYQRSARGDELVSVDGGQSWGRLANLRIGSRNATPEDVTHVRWRISAEHAQTGRGHIAYSGIVR